MVRRKRGDKDSSGSESEKSILSKCHRTRGPSDDQVGTKTVSDILKETNSVLFDADISSSGENVFEISHTSVHCEEIDVQSNMASGSSQTSAKVCTDSEKLDLLLTAMADMRKSQEGLKKMVESKIDKLRTDLLENIDGKVRALRDELSTDIGMQTARIDRMMTTVQSMQTRIESLETNSSGHNGNNSTQDLNDDRLDGHIMRHGNPLDDPELTITASGIPYQEGENLVQKAEDIMRSLGETVSSSVKVTAAVRLPNRWNEKPGFVKISFRNIKEKVTVLRNKFNLKDSTMYKDVYLKSSKSHAERLIELNARAILRELPNGRSLRVDANGRIKQRSPQQQQQPQEQNQER